jgi:hypothetical protein
MLNRFPEQAKDRKGLVLCGLLFLAFAAFMGYVESIFGAILFGSFGLLMFVPPLVLNEAQFERFMKISSLLSGLG